MEKYSLSIMGIIIFLIGLGLQVGFFEGTLVFGIFYGAACICKKLEEIRDKV